MEETKVEPTDPPQGTRSAAPVLLLVFACLVILSICPLGMADGSFPTAEYHIRVQDVNGEPISGAHMSVRLRGGNEEALGFPFDNYSVPNSLVSDAQGQIVVTHLTYGFEFGGRVTFLSMLLGTGVPQYVCTISSPDYRTTHFTTQQLFDRAFSGDAPDEQGTIMIDGEKLPLDIYEYEVTLRNR